MAITLPDGDDEAWRGDDDGPGGHDGGGDVDDPEEKGKYLDQWYELHHESGAADYDENYNRHYIDIIDDQGNKERWYLLKVRVSKEGYFVQVARMVAGGFGPSQELPADEFFRYGVPSIKELTPGTPLKSPELSPDMQGVPVRTIGGFVRKVGRAFRSALPW